MLSTPAPHPLGTRTAERGVALVAAIALTLLGALVVVAIIMSAMSSVDTSRTRLDGAANDVLARDAASLLSDTFSDLSGSEFNGFTVDRATLQRHAARLGDGAAVVPNNSGRVRSDLRTVDMARVARNGRFTLIQRLDEQRLGYWQVYSVKTPTWGVTPGGRVSVYVRTWATSSDGNRLSATPKLHRVELRPTWFADFQMLFDGPFVLLAGSRIEGRIHSNGFDTSLFNQYNQLVDRNVRIEERGAVDCRPTARISAARGRINVSCAASQVRTPTGQRFNLLRTRETVDRIRSKCGTPATVQVFCSTATGDISVQLSAGNRMTVRNASGGVIRVLDATWRGDRPGDSQGAIVLTYGNVTLSGQLGARGRGMVVAAAKSDSATYGTGSAPSAWIRSSGAVGANPADPTSTFGVVAEGDFVFDHQPGQACGATFYGAAITVTGLVSMNPQWRVPFALAGPTCSRRATIVGSMSGHYPPYLYSTSNGGYSARSYGYLASLYHNPPPMYPTAADWQVTRMAPADLGCFRSGTLDAREGSGCV